MEVYVIFLLFLLLQKLIARNQSNLQRKYLFDKQSNFSSKFTFTQGCYRGKEEFFHFLSDYMFRFLLHCFHYKFHLQLSQNSFGLWRADGRLKVSRS